MSGAQVRKLDRLFGLYMRRKHTVCRMCHRPLDDTAQVSHCYGRANMAVRWDERNCYLLHDGCHREWEKMSGEQRADWLTFVLGKDGAAALERDAVSSRKWTEAELAAMAAKFR